MLCRIAPLVLYCGFSNPNGLDGDPLTLGFFFRVLGLCCFCLGLFALFSITFGLCMVESFPSFADTVVASLPIVLLFGLEHHSVIFDPFTASYLCDPFCLTGTYSRSFLATSS